MINTTKNTNHYEKIYMFYKLIVCRTIWNYNLDSTLVHLFCSINGFAPLLCFLFRGCFHFKKLVTEVLHVLLKFLNVSDGILNNGGFIHLKPGDEPKLKNNEKSKSVKLNEEKFRNLKGSG